MRYSGSLILLEIIFFINTCYLPLLAGDHDIYNVHLGLEIKWKVFCSLVAVETVAVEAYHI